ncbi:MAG: hypothetical protein P1U39_07120 [Legionellaceae bacterium]|nr:hypothetical protein [Legionellaceae bacterium]
MPVNSPRLDITPFIRQWIEAYMMHNQTRFLISDLTFIDSLPTLRHALHLDATAQLPQTFYLNLLALSDWEHATKLNHDMLPQWEIVLTDILAWLKDIRDNTAHQLEIKHIQVFRLENDMDPPEQARLGTDYFVYNSEDFEAHTNIFSYQLSRAYLHEGATNITVEQNLDELLPNHVIEFNSVPEASFYIYGSRKTNATLLHLRFNPITTVTQRDISILFVTIIRNLSEHKTLRECVIIMQNSLFNEPNIRQEIHQDVIELLEQYQCHVLPHLFLLTKPHIQTLEIQEQTDVAFVPLKQCGGYYLSSSAVAATVLRTIQASKPTPNLPEPTRKTSRDESQQNSHYIIKTAEEKSTQYRATKQQDTTALKTSICLTHTHVMEQAQTHTQTQTQTQTQTMQQHETMDQAVTQQQQQQQQQNTGFLNPFRDKTCMTQFSQHLMRYARKRYHDACTVDDKLYHDNHFLTKHHHKTDFWRRIAHSQIVSDQITWTLFGRHYTSTEFRGLKQGSFVFLDNILVDSICDNIKQLADGLEPDTKIIDKGPELLAMSLLYRPATLIGYSGQHQNDVESRDPAVLPIVAKGSHASSYQNLLSIPALLRDEDLACVTSAQQRKQLLDAAQTCLDLFNSSKIKTLELDVNLALSHLRKLIVFHCKHKDISSWDKFATYLEHPCDQHHDHLKIMTYFIASGYSDKLQQLIDLLDCLVERDLLLHFYYIYFKYAQTVTSVADLLDITSSQTCHTVFRHNAAASTQSYCEREMGTSYQAISPFLTLLKDTDPVHHKRDWSYYHTFAYHFLVHAARLNIPINPYDMKNIRQTWINIERLINTYTQQSQPETYRLQGVFITHLCIEKGFDLRATYCAKTILTGLETVIAQAIKHHTLEEQLQEWGLSLLWSDAPYMLTHDHFKIITRDMQGRLSQLHLIAEAENLSLSDNFTSSYDVYENQLRDVLHNQCMKYMDHQVDALYSHQIENETLIIKTFRYLGGTTLREPMAFYRALEQAQPAHADHVYLYFKQLLLTYFVLNYTGEYYTQAIDTTRLSQNFITFLRQKRYQTDMDQMESMHRHEPNRHQIMLEKIEGEYHDTIQACVRDFIQTLERLNYRALTGNHSLWTLYKNVINNTKPNTKPSAGTSTLGKIAHHILDSVGCASVPTTFATVPPVFKKAFSTKQLSSFLLLNQHDLLKCNAIYRAYPGLLLQLIKIKILDWRTQVHQDVQTDMSADWITWSSKFLFAWLQKVYPDLCMQVLIRDMPKLDLLIEQYFILVLNQEIKPLWKPLVKCLEQHPSLSAGQTLTSMINQLRNASQYNATKMPHMIDALQNHPVLLKNSTSNHTLHLICTTYFAQPQRWLLTSLLERAETLLHHEDDQVACDILTTLINAAPVDITQENGPFFLTTTLTHQQLKNLHALLQANHLPQELIQRVWEDHPETEFTELQAFLTTCHPSIVPHISSLALALYDQTAEVVSMQALLEKMCALPLAAARQLAGLVTAHHVDITRVAHIIDCEDIDHQLHCLEHEYFNTHTGTARFEVHTARVKTYIAAIRFKSVPENTEEQPLSPREQALLLQDYQTMMSYMQTHPVFIGKDIHHEFRPLTLCELSEPQRKILYQRLSQKLQDKRLNDEKKHAYRLMLLALIAEAMFRSPVNKFPREPQLLCQLHQLRDPHAHIQGVKTGGGKSIISEISALMLCATGWTVDIATENDVLAQVGLLKFSGLYDALGVPYAKQTIQPDTPIHQYIQGGIHHGTPAHFSFFRTHVALKKKQLPKRVALLCDEIDATLTTTIQYRLAGVLDPIFQDLNSWSAVFKTLLKFVKDDTRYLNNFCDKPEDILNFVTYFKEQHHDKKLLNFINILERNYQETLCLLLDSARVPEALSKGIDYRNVMKTASENGHDRQYAAPIMNVGTKRPEPAVRFGNGIQELLHEYCDGQLAPGEVTFLKQAITQTLLVTSAKNFFDQYRLNGGLIYGWTGTPGSPRALQEFAAHHGLQAYHYPIFHPDYSENLGVTFVNSEEDVLANVLTTLLDRKRMYPEQPILIITDSPKDMEAMHAYLQQHAPQLLLQAYDGHAAAGCSEHGVVHRAGQRAVVTVSNPSLSRGTDIEGEVFLINTATDITEEEATQIEGRVARNGRPGQYCHIINQTNLTETAATEITADHNPAERFKAHQAQVSKHRQRERMKTRLLEEVRHFIVSNYILRLRQEADAIYEQQYGSFASLISDTTLHQVLRDVNQALERDYLSRLGNQSALSQAEEEAFIQAAIQIYHEQQDILLPQQALNHFEAIEPLIRLHLITHEPELLTIPGDLSLQHLTILSEICSHAWQAAGHQHATLALKASDDVMQAFKPYFESECSLRVATADALEQRGLLHINHLVHGIHELKTSIQRFNWQEVIFGVQQDLTSQNATLSNTTRLSITQLFPSDKIEQLKDLVIDYLEVTKQQIQARQWDAITWPDFRVEWLQRWWSHIQTVLTTLSYLSWGSSCIAGPVPFIITRFIVPPIMSCLKILVKSLFADSESTMVQVLIGLDEAFDDISHAVTIFTRENPENMTIGEFMDTLSPLLNNQAILAIMNQLGESQDWQLGTMFTLLPELMQVLHAYRDRNIQALSEPEIMINITQTLLRSDVMNPLIDDEIKARILKCLDVLPEDFSTQFNACRFEDLLKLFHVISHPKFHEFLSQLPEDSTYGDLISWLNTVNIDDLPNDIQAPKRTLDAYQQDHERIAADTNQAFRHLKQTYHLQANHIMAYRAALTPKIIKQKPCEVPEFSIFMFTLQWLEAQWLKLAIAYTALVVFNLAFFQFNAVLITCLFIAAVLASVGKALFTHMASIQLPDIFPEGIAPPLNETDEPDEPEHEHKNNRSSYKYPYLANIMKFGLFGFDGDLSDTAQSQNNSLEITPDRLYVIG